MNPITQEQFIERCKQRDPNMDYSKTVYAGMKQYITVTCPIHGDFEVKADVYTKLTNVKGCSQCRPPKALKTTEEFIADAKSVHGDKYDYSKVNYTGCKDHVEIICPNHGPFRQTPDSHLTGAGCMHCWNERRSEAFTSNTAEFVEKAIAIHGDKYDYSKVSYVNNVTPVTIICKKHGEFNQTPSTHLDGSGCPKCKIDKLRMACTKTTEQFIADAKVVHGDTYDYSKVNYVLDAVPVEIICQKHGSFMQKPQVHLQGSGCPACANNVKLDTTTFIERARAFHGDKYDYSESVYVNAKTPIKITCPIHGPFYQTGEKHAKLGRGCQKCGGSAKSNKDEFVEKARKIYGNKYTYDKVVYRTADDHITVTCPTHGDFSVTVSNFLRGKQCPKCSSTRLFTQLAKGKVADLYVVKIYFDTEPFYKIGVTVRGVKERMSQLKNDLKASNDRISQIFTYEEIICIPMLAQHAAELEKTLHATLSQFRYVSSVYFQGHTECFTTIDPIKHLLSTKLHIFDMRSVSYVLHLEVVKHGYDVTPQLTADIVEHAVRRFYNASYVLPVYELPDGLCEELYEVTENWLAQSEELNPSDSLVALQRISNVLLVLKLH